MIACRWVTPIVLMVAVSAAFGQGEITTTYEYDEVGNRVAASDLIRFTDTQVFSLSLGTTF